MTPSARVEAAIQVLDLIIAAARDNGPAADTIIADWFKTRRFAGSGDRRAVRDLIYHAIRRFGEPPVSGRAAMVALANDDHDMASLFDGSPHGPAPIRALEPAAIPALLPGWLQPLIPVDEHETLLGRAPFDVRVNTLRTTRERIMLLLKGAVPIEGTENGLRLPEKIPLSRPELAGLVEVQDAGSQMIADACDVQPGMAVIDLCAGAGGKALALAAAMMNEGHIMACDTDRRRLGQLAPRAAAAGATIIETRLLNPGREYETLSDLRMAADCVLVDAPCSGSGTWRRNPELRWRLTPDRLRQVAALQARLLDIGAALAKPGGALVYAVCSMLHQEGQDQIDCFLAKNASFSCELSRQLTPLRDGTDGFYFARLRRTC